jgi:hypothetical protein
MSESLPCLAVAKLKLQLAEWVRHCEKQGFCDRLRLQEWLAERFTKQELAAMIDAEIIDGDGNDVDACDKRTYIQRFYLDSKYGPADENGER